MKRDDDLLREGALAALRSDNRLDAASLQLDVDARDGVVELTGSVDFPWQKFYAQHVLEQVPGVKQVANLVLVEPVNRRTDEQIAQELLASYIQDPYLDEHNIHPEVEEGVVYLRGRVESLVRKRLAGVLAWWRAGVRDVINDLEVEPPESDSNEEIANAIEVVLDKDPLVDHTVVHLRVTGHGEVTLTGALPSPEQRRAAEDDAWCVVGVRAVNNQIMVAPSEGPLEPEPGR